MINENDCSNPQLRSFVEVAPDCPFPIQNLPYGVFRPPGSPNPRVGVAIGNRVLDLAEIALAGLFDSNTVPGAAAVFSAPALNRFMALGPLVWSAVRRTISQLLRADESTLRDDPAMQSRCLHPQAAVRMHLPAQIGDYTDFYSSRQHAINVGAMFRDPANALPVNWLHIPIGYHGRSSSVMLSGTPVRRPCGQARQDANAPVRFGVSAMLDFELELGAFVGPGNALGEPIPMAEAESHLFGLVLLNDWSARDIQRWEYVPLGPFLGKNFMTSISPWVVPFEALAPFRVALPEQDPEPLPYLRAPRWGYNINLEVFLQTANSTTPHLISSSNARHLYWTFAQQLAHHTSGGCNLRPGDLLGTGTISGPVANSSGSLLELAWGGKHPLTMPGGEHRVALEDGDTLTMTGWVQGDGYLIGFGECSGTVLPALQQK